MAASDNTTRTLAMRDTYTTAEPIQPIKINDSSGVRTHALSDQRLKLAP